MDFYSGFCRLALALVAYNSSSHFASIDSIRFDIDEYGDETGQLDLQTP